MAQTSDENSLAQEEQFQKLMTLRDLARNTLHHYDSRMRFNRMIQVFMQMIVTISLLSIPFINIMAPFYHNYLYITAVSVFGAFASLYQFALNPQMRWAQYLIYRRDLQKRLLDLDLAVHSGKGMDKKEAEDVYRQLSEILHAEQSLWYYGDMKPDTMS